MPTFPVLSQGEIVDRLNPPSGPVRMVLDTDTYNEVDDQFALAYAALSPEAGALEAVYAAPFHNNRSSGPGDGMERSYEEILRVLSRIKRPADGLAFRGSSTYLPGPDVAVDSPAVQDLVARSHACDEPLYVLTVGAPTNVASALLTAPELVRRIVVVWLGGQPTYLASAREFNLQQDLHASRILFDSGVPLVQIPCTNVAEHLRTTVPELEACLRGRSELGDYLCDIVCSYHEDHFAWSKVIWDIAAVAWLINPGWVQSKLEHSPILTERVAYSFDDSRHFIRIATHINRDPVFRDLFRKFAEV